MNPTPHDVRQRAYTATWKAIHAGRLVKPELCEGCGLSKPLYAHHQDYDKPEEVTWLCGSCHKKAHYAAGEVNHRPRGKSK